MRGNEVSVPSLSLTSHRFRAHFHDKQKLSFEMLSQEANRTFPGTPGTGGEQVNVALSGLTGDPGQDLVQEGAWGKGRGRWSWGLRRRGYMNAPRGL